MKNQLVVDELIELDIYKITDYDKEYEPNQEFMTVADGNDKIRKVEDNNLSDDEIKLLISAKQTKYLKRIASMITLLAVLTIIGACYWAFMFLKIKSMF